MRKVNSAEPEGFADFWAIWQPRMRHTDGRGDARECFRKHILMGADPADIIDGATGFFRAMKPEDAKFVPLAASWLNKEAYGDWAKQERAYQAHIAAKAQQSNVVPINAPKSKFLQEWERRQVGVE